MSFSFSSVVKQSTPEFLLPLVLFLFSEFGSPLAVLEYGLGAVIGTIMQASSDSDDESLISIGSGAPGAFSSHRRRFFIIGEFVIFERLL